MNLAEVYLASCRISDPTDVARTISGLGEMLYRLKRFAEAEPFFTEWLKDEGSKAKDGRQYFRTLSLLGGTIAGQEDRHAEAEDYLRKGYEGMRKLEEVSAKEKTRALKRILALYEDWRKPKELKIWREKLEVLTAEAAASKADRSK